MADIENTAGGNGVGAGAGGGTVAPPAPGPGGNTAGGDAAPGGGAGTGITATAEGDNAAATAAAGFTWPNVMEVSKSFEGIDKLFPTGDWPMWSSRVYGALEVLYPHWGEESGTPPHHSRPILNGIHAKMDNSGYVHVREIKSVKELLGKLKERFQPSTSTTQSNDVFKLFKLGDRPPFLIQQTLDEFEQILAKIKETTEFPDAIAYKALTGTLPPYYVANAQTPYETRVEGAMGTLTTSELIQ